MTPENNPAQSTWRAVVAGELCLDIIPRLGNLTPDEFRANFRPGRMLTVREALFSAGGVVPNTGLALHMLGIPTRLVGKVGADHFGDVLRQVIASYDSSLAEGIVVDPTVSTSYTLVINPPGLDRMFVHNPGANDAFCAQDVADSVLANADLLHFGYPPVMEHMFQNGGFELSEMFRRAHAAGMITSLDTTFPDPTSAGGNADWQAIFQKTLPYVDIFLPSIEELLFMVHRQLYDEFTRRGGILPLVSPELLSQVSQELLDMGARMVVLKLGERGLYLRTADERALIGQESFSGGIVREGAKLSSVIDVHAWANREMWVPCFQVNVAGTTGSGDATIAGFLGALLRGLEPGAAMTMAVAVGACNVEAADALSGLRTWEATSQRIASGWKRRPLELDASGWSWDATRQIWIGPDLYRTRIEKCNLKG